MKRAFTLIELLVVIAIIAILAAILFPVFAQAKNSAKSSAALSNAKQLTMACMMYGNDYDDTIPLFLSGHWADLGAAVGNTPQRAMSWVETTQPYVKNHRLYTDPIRGDALGIFDNPPSTVAPSTYRNQNRYPMFGFNYLFLSPWDGNCDLAASRSFTKATDPAATVLLTQSRLFTLETTRGYFMNNAPGMWPIIAPHPTQCIVYDGSVGSGNWSMQNPTGPITSSAYMDMRQGSNVAWLDGHAKWMRDTNLAAGTDYGAASASNAAEGAVITDKAKYLWNLDDDFFGF